MQTNNVAFARAGFPAEKLAAYRGQWIAFSDDLREVVGSAVTLEHLESILEQRRIDPQDVFFEFVPGPEGDLFLSPEAAHEISVPE